MSLLVGKASMASDYAAIQSSSVRLLSSQNSLTAYGFFIGKNLLLTNAHVLKHLGNCQENNITLYTTDIKQTSFCQKKEYCSTTTDFCVLRTTEDSGTPITPNIESILVKTSLVLVNSQIKLSTGIHEEGQYLSHCFNTHYGESGSPILNERGEWIALHEQIIKYDKGCPRGLRSSGTAVLSATILSELAAMAPSLYEQIRK